MGGTSLDGAGGARSAPYLQGLLALTGGLYINIYRVRHKFLSSCMIFAIIVPKAGFGGVDVNNNWRISGSRLLPLGFYSGKWLRGTLAQKTAPK